MKKYRVFPRGWQIWLLIALGLPTSVFADIPVLEWASLVAIYNNANGAGWTNHENWNTDPTYQGTECSWVGITCDQDAITCAQPMNPCTHVISISLSNNNLNGVLPPLTYFSALEYFDVSDNPQLHGPLPALTGLTVLQYFDAIDDQFSGPIPCLSTTNSCNSGLIALIGFEVSGNQLTGSIPSLAGLTALEYFLVAHNHLTGPAPTPPQPNALVPGFSSVCPNALSFNPTVSSSTDFAWDDATGATPWWEGADAMDSCNIIFSDGFENFL